MPLRSGKQYLKPHVCSACGEFHSHKIFNYKCSSCSDVKHPCHTLTIDTTVLDNWIDEHTISSSTPRLQSLIDHFSKSSVSNHDNFLLLSTLLELRGEGKLLRAGDAVKILGTSGDNARGHILAAHVADWWNIRSSSTYGKWPHYLVCYYGQFNSPSRPRILPPRPPNPLLRVTSTSSFCAYIHLQQARNLLQSAYNIKN